MVVLHLVNAPRIQKINVETEVSFVRNRHGDARDRSWLWSERVRQIEKQKDRRERKTTRKEEKENFKERRIEKHKKIGRLKEDLNKMQETYWWNYQRKTGTGTGRKDRTQVWLKKKKSTKKRKGGKERQTCRLTIVFAEITDLRILQWSVLHQWTCFTLLVAFIYVSVPNMADQCSYYWTLL